MDHIQLLTLHAIYEADSEGRLPAYLGSTIRGVIGHRLREYACQHPNLPCHRCTLSKECSYALHFCSPGNEGGAVNPYVLRPLVRDKEIWHAGERMTFEITLIGRTSEQAAFFIDALQDDRRQGWGAGRMPFRLQQIVDPIRGTLIWSDGRTWLRNCQPMPIPLEQRRARSVLLRFDHPLRLLVNRRLRNSLSFVDLIQSLTRRLSLLSQAYTDKHVQWNEEDLLKAASKIHTAAERWRPVDFKRYSINRAEGDKLSLPAIEGWVRYEGDLTPFTPLLAAGERIHIGKNATIGFGRYQAIYDQ
ncbi:CRISPR system precrRNA processing endoribonuclease RAMP protein Cas6 [Cohnella fermenti]|uniref:CRISPR system precrRNA processing endoribonuclease RAMP protein Cas6 n=1 Tax=Cohnella fermenti TaxID=2565925 RepID=A0A4S4C9F0_9BACL|nr:CRISPR system precrRNA processing endoribonuclease RAMP protein Cas6 [Cohnella fermenti]THF84690.1 CRISPR system precrRNA processing endoribonuclease RAMP protein Cas6 [Cohnella fermenti]